MAIPSRAQHQANAPARRWTRDPLVWTMICVGWTIAFGVTAGALVTTHRTAASAFGVVAAVGLVGLAIFALRALVDGIAGVVTTLARRIRGADKDAVVDDIRYGIAVTVKICFVSGGVVSALVGGCWAYGDYVHGTNVLGLGYVGEHVCAARLQDALSTVAPERDPSVEKCTRAEPASDPAIPFTCIARMLDRDGEYRFAPCAVACRTSGAEWAKNSRNQGLTIDEICPHSEPRSRH
jgi:hypothetical protein